MSIRTLILAVCVLFPAYEASAREKFTIVSDIDDTLRVSHVDDRLNLIFRFIFSNRAFSGIPEVLRSWEDSQTAERFVYLTAAPAVVKPRVRSFLRAQGFPEGTVIGKQSKDPRSTAEYKIRRLEALLEVTSERLILIGDDTQFDVHAYYTLFMKYPKRIADIYIRQIRGRGLPRGVYPIITSYDIARHEYSSGRFSFAALQKVADRILTDPVESRVIPRFQECPVPLLLIKHHEEVEALDRQVRRRVAEICEKRLSHLQIGDYTGVVPEITF